MRNSRKQRPRGGGTEVLLNIAHQKVTRRSVDKGNCAPHSPEKSKTGATTRTNGAEVLYTAAAPQQGNAKEPTAAYKCLSQLHQRAKRCDTHSRAQTGTHTHTHTSRQHTNQQQQQQRPTALTDCNDRHQQTDTPSLIFTKGARRRGTELTHSHTQRKQAIHKSAAMTATSDGNRRLHLKTTTNRKTPSGAATTNCNNHQRKKRLAFMNARCLPCTLASMSSCTRGPVLC